MALLDWSSKDEKVEAGVSRDNSPGGDASSHVGPSLFTLPEEDPARVQDSLPAPVDKHLDSEVHPPTTTAEGSAPQVR